MEKSTKLKTVLSGLVLISSVVSVSATWAHGNCTPYTAELHLEGPSPFGPLNGSGIYNIGDLPPQPAQVSVVLKGSATFDPTAPVFKVKFSDMVLFPPGVDGSLNVLTAVDRAVATVTGPGMFTSKTRSRITGGSGIYQDVTGRVRSTSITTVDLTTGKTVSDISVHGKICGIGEAGNR
jgi:hypothetical protein